MSVREDAIATEMAALVATLHGFREGVLDKLAGLSDDQARRSTVGSGTNLAGLIQHLTFVEAKWFGHIVGGTKPTRGKRSMKVESSVSLSTVRAEYRAASAESDAIIAKLGDPAARVMHNGKPRTLRWAILSVIGETARDAGHADIIREQIDGKTGR
jgi:uncharacterized damage-inducible protein DinB